VQLPGSPAPLTIPQIIPTTALSLNGSLPLFDGFSSTNRLRAARSGDEAAVAEYDWARFQLEREVKGLFYKAVGARALKEVAEQNVAMLEDHLRDVKSFKEAGLSTNFDVLRVEVQVSHAKSELLDATDNIELAKNRLAEALGETNESRELQGELPKPDESWAAPKATAPQVTDGTPEASGRKDLQALRSRTEALTQLDAAADRFWVPRISLVGQYMSYNNRNDQLADWDAYRGSYQVGLSATWPLFDGLTSYAKSRQAAEQRYQGEKSLAQAQLHAHQDFELWKRKFRYQCAVYRSREADVGKAAESVRLAKAGRKAGSRTNADLLDAEAELYRARAGLVNAQVGAVEALLNLELATGQQLADLK
jgi:outer membrane protein TolC